MKAALLPAAALRLEGTTRTPVEERLAEETAIVLLYNGVPHAVMMCTPQDLDDFALGFSLSEGIVAHPAELAIVDRLPREHGIALHLQIPAARFEALQSRRRTIPGRSGCGLCGAESLEQAIRPVRRLANAVTITASALNTAFAALARRQPLNAECGALHAAAALQDGALTVREDVGRHNALDKVIGALACAATQADAVLITSRASYELVHKCAEAGIGVLAAVSAPTAFAVRLAQEAGLTLIGFARDARLTVYSNAARILDHA